MKLFFYKWVNKITNKTILVNFDWADNFEELKKIMQTNIIDCIEISKKEFKLFKKFGF